MSQAAHLVDGPGSYPGGMSFAGNTMLTISTFQAARAAQPCVGTIFAKIISGTRHIDGDHLVVEDFSGQLEVWVPRSLHHRGTGVQKWFAFDLLAEPDGIPAHPVVVSAQRSRNRPAAA